MGSQALLGSLLGLSDESEDLDVDIGCMRETTKVVHVPSPQVLKRGSKTRPITIDVSPLSSGDSSSEESEEDVVQVMKKMADDGSHFNDIEEKLLDDAFDLPDHLNDNAQELERDEIDESVATILKQMTPSKLQATTPSKPANTPRAFMGSGGSRYFSPIDISIRCFNCDGVGHQKWQCTQPKKLIPCFMCASFRHRASACKKVKNDKACCWICSAQHDPHYCQSPSSSQQESVASHLHCLVCGARGHLNCAEVPAKQEKEVFCCNCACKGHLQNTCKKPRMTSMTTREQLLGYNLFNSKSKSSASASPHSTKSKRKSMAKNQCREMKKKSKRPRSKTMPKSRETPSRKRPKSTPKQRRASERRPTSARAPTRKKQRT